MKSEFKAVKQALEEHLSAINENTSEIQAMFDYLQELEVKVEKVSQRLDQLQLNQNITLEKPTISPLTQTERRAFLTLYTEESPLSFEEIATRAKIPEALIPECISSLVNKGVPLQRSYFNNQLFLKLDPQFKEMQAKENLINLTLQSFIN